MSLSDNVNHIFYSMILKKQLKKSICPELERTSFYEKFNYLAVRVYGKENLPAFEILRVEWTQQFQQSGIDLYKHFLLQPSESS